MVEKINNVPGDIDLTENLDFRNVVRKEIPTLPAAWKGNRNKLNKNKNNIYITSNNYAITVNYNNTTNSWVSDDIIFNYDLSNTLYDSINVNEFYPQTQNTLTVTISDVNYTRTYNNYTEYNGGLKLRFVNKELKYDIFGNEIKNPKPIPSIPWKTIRNTEYIPDIPWVKKRSFSSLKQKQSYWDDRIPWESNDYTNWIDVKLSNKANKARHFIAWLANKSTSFINEYLNPDDETDLKYLNNMSWIRIKDAVID